MGVIEALELGHNSVAIAIDKGKNSQQAVQWTIDQFVKGSKDMKVVLVHVKTHYFQSQTSNSTGFAPSESEVKQLFLPFRGYCTRKGVNAYEVVLHDIDVASALVSYIEKNSVGNIVVGASNHNAFTRRFKQQDVPTSLEKLAPDFCTLYVIYKGKVQSMRASSICHIPSATSKTTFESKSSRNYVTDSSKSSSSSGSENGFSNKIPGYPSSRPYQGIGQATAPYNKTNNLDNAFRMQGWGQVPNIPPNANNNFDSSSRSQGMGQSTNSSRFQGVAQSHVARVFNNTKLDISSRNLIQEGVGMPNEYPSEQRPRISASAQISISPDEPDDEVKQLKLEIKKAMDLYKISCEQASLAKKRADYLQSGGDQDNIENVKLVREAMDVVAELERQKCQAAICAAQMTARLVEKDSQNEKSVGRATKREDGRRASNGGGQVSHRVYSFNEIEVATNNFSESLKIGEGGYGPVYKAMLQHTPVAIKVLRPDASQGLKQFQQEIEVLERIRHPNMVLLLGTCPKYGCLVYEFMEYGSLEDRLCCKNQTPPIPWRTRFKIAAEVASALLFLHEAKPEPMVHRDLKPANILLDRNYTSKIADVGLARLVPAAVANEITQYHMTAAAGTFCYIDPEYQQTGKLGTKSDIYSLGIVLLQLITAKPPMALAHHVEEAIDEGNFEEILDPSISDWPVEEALAMSKLAIRCSELRKKDRPDLDTEVLPELIRLRNFAMKS